MTICADPILKVTDGITSVSLIAGKYNGFNLMDWEPAISQAKSGGSYMSNPMVDGRRLTMRKLDNPIETLSVVVSAPSQNQVALHISNLLRLLEKATQFWTTSWQTDPVWIESRGPLETNTRYAAIHNYSMDNISNPFRQPMFNPSALTSTQEISLIIERDQWQETAPSESTPIEISSTYTFNSVSLGQPATSTNHIYLSNKQVESSISHVYVFDASGPTFTQRLGTSLPYDLLPSSPAAGDILYVGVNTAISEANRFNNVIFNLSVAGTTYTLVWEYWNGAWVSLSVTDETSQLKTIGQGGVFFNHPSDWTTTSVNGVTGYWIRGRLTVGGGTRPRQDTIQVYSATSSYVEVDEAQIPGDIPALMKALVDNVGGSTNGFRMASRSLSRGTNFTPYINMGNTQNPTGVSVQGPFAGGTNTTIGLSDYRSPTGLVTRWSPAGVEEDNIVDIVISSPLVDEYVGEYMVIASVFNVGGVIGDFSLQFAIDEGTFLGPVVQLTSTNTHVNLGYLGVSRSSVLTTYNQLRITIIGYNTNGAPGDIYIPQIVLLPVDEWSGAFSFPQMGTGETAVVDSTTFKKSIDAYSQTSAGLITGGASVTSVDRFKMQSNSDQRLWFVFTGNVLDVAAKVTLSRSSRYFALRGGQ